MQEQHLNDLKDQIITNLAEAEGTNLRAKVTQAIDRLTEENKLLSLPPDEYRLLLDYRLWKQSPDVATGIFHWRQKTT